MSSKKYYMGKNALSYLWSKIKTTFVKNSDIANVAKTGSYNDLTNKPTIPTVNNATLTIQKNGTNVQTFTANQGTNATANITVPTKTSELTNDANFLANSNTYLNIHPENNAVLIPFINNDIAFLKQKGGNYEVTYDGVVKDINIDNVFDASPSYWSINTTDIETIVFTLALHKVFTWSNQIYIDFGSAGWRAKDVKIEVINTNYANDVWTQKYYNANNAGNIRVNTSHTPVGASNAGGGFNKVRITFKNWNSPTNSRIAQIGIYNYGSQGVRETFMSRGIDDQIYRNLTPASNNKFNIGSSEKKWANIYATTFTGALSGTASNATKVNNLTVETAVPANAKFTDTTYDVADTNANGLMSKEDKTKLNGIATGATNVTTTTVSGWGYTKNAGTITGIKMNGASKGTSGVVDLRNSNYKSPRYYRETRQINRRK